MQNAINVLNTTIAAIAVKGKPTFEEREAILDCIRELHEEAEAAYQEAMVALTELDGVCGLDYDEVNLDNNNGSFGEVVEAVLNNIEEAFTAADEAEDAE